ncbi:MAG: futalosine hydrolase [Desulfovibrio sp.]
MLLFVTATEREMRSAFALQGALPPLRQGAVELWCAAGRQAALLVTGVGLVNAALALGAASGLPGLTGVVNLGVAGAFDIQALPLGTIALASREIWPEYGLERAEGPGADARALGFPLWGNRRDADALWDRIELEPDAAAHALGLRLNPAWPKADCLSVSTVTTTGHRAAALRRNYRADLENMEGFALAYGCGRAGLPFLELRTVSNRVGSRAAEDWALDRALEALGKAAAGLLG